MTGRTFRDAIDEDIPRVVELVNHAFQVERPFKRGDRTDFAQIRNLLSKGRFLLMEHGGRVDACVYLEPRNTHVYVGMLSVDPERQGSGLGSTLLAEVERQCRATGYEALDLRFVHLRDDLKAYYIKRGFTVTGTESADGVQNFTVPVHFICMSKEL
jgi:N-acetylglutamate synthase-like GNAT family acetyltransferase